MNKAGQSLTAAAMLSRRALLTASKAAKPTSQASIAVRSPFSTAQRLRAQTETTDPDMNGGYINPPAIKRSFRDPYGEWTHPQERRNFGEPVHEDNDILGVFSLEEYTHMTPARGALLWAGFLASIAGLSFAVYSVYPDRPSAPKEYPGGLDSELGGPGAVRARQSGDEVA